MYTADKQSVLWDEIEKYGTENDLGLDERKLVSVNTLLRKISRSHSEKKTPSHTLQFLSRFKRRLMQYYYFFWN
jgi:hypothetical protein